MNKYFLLIACIIVTGSCKKTAVVIDSPPPPKIIKVPQLTTNEAYNITRYSVYLSAKIVDTFSTGVMEQGFIVDTLPMPTTTHNFSKIPVTLDSIGSFTVAISNFPANQKFYVRAYGVNSYGTGYGNEIEFNTFQEKIFNGIVELTTQQQVADFGANHYSRINGDITIDGPITDLSPLRDLVAVNNGFTIKNTLLVNFKGLENLEFTGIFFANNFRIENNQNLVDFSGLSKLRITRGYFYVINNNSLLNLDGLDSLIAVGAGEFRIQDCSKIQNINGLKSFVFVGGSLYLINNPSLTNIKGFGKLSTIGENLTIINNPALQNLDGLEKIESLADGLELTNNNSLTDVKGLSNLISVGDELGLGAITIDGNGVLKDLSGFNKLTKLDYIFIRNNSSLLNLAFNSLQSVKHDVQIDNNAGLQDLTGLEKLNSVGNLEIRDNSSLINLKGLEGLQSIYNVTYSISIGGNHKLVSLLGLENLNAGIGSITIDGNTSLTDFCPLKLLLSQGTNPNFSTFGNAINPDQQGILTNCP